MRVDTSQLANTALFNINNVSNLIALSLESLASGVNAEISPAAGIEAAVNQSQLDSLAQASANAQDASSLVQTAQGSLSEISDMLRNIQISALAAANTGVNDISVRAAYQNQITDTLQAIQALATQTQYNGRPLLDGSANGVTFQLGANAGQSVTVSLGSAQTSALGMGAVPNVSLAQIDVTTPQGAADALAVTNAAITQVAGQNADLGALQANAIQPAARALTQQFNALSATNSQIYDTDYGLALTRLSSQLLQRQAGLAVLAQANLSGLQSLSLLS